MSFLNDLSVSASERILASSSLLAMTGARIPARIPTMATAIRSMRRNSPPMPRVSVDLIHDLHDRKDDGERDAEDPAENEHQHHRLDEPEGHGDAVLGLRGVVVGKPAEHLRKHAFAALHSQD